jgi:hypothetical protein
MDNNKNSASDGAGANARTAPGRPGLWRLALRTLLACSAMSCAPAQAGSQAQDPTAGSAAAFACAPPCAAHTDPLVANGEFIVSRITAHSALLTLRAAPAPTRGNRAATGTTPSSTSAASSGPPAKTSATPSASHTFEIEAGPDGDIRRATVRKIIDLIRVGYSGNFNWDSRRMNRIIILSVRPEDDAELEAFLMTEFADLFKAAR